MKDFRRFVLWITLALVIVLAALSVCGAFLGADRAKALFNSLPMAVYWGAFLVTLLVGCLIVKRLILVPALLLTHAGCIAILPAVCGVRAKDCNFRRLGWDATSFPVAK